LYVRDLSRGTTRRIDVTPSGTPGAYPFVQDASMTRQGRFVLFVSYASNLVPGDTNQVDDVFLRDLWRGTTRRVNLSVTGEQADNGYLQPYPTPNLGRIASISADGRFVAFASRALNLVPDGQPNPYGINHIFLRDVQRSTTSRVDVTASGVLEGGFPYQPVISADGGTIVYRGTGDNLVAGLGYVVRDLPHRRGRSVQGRATPPWGPAFRFPHETPPVISAHGDFVAFVTGNGAELVPGVGPFLNVLRWTRRDGTFRQASLGNPAP